MKVLFVCTGNICRSPMAEAILRDLLRREGLQGIEVGSAGLYALAGEEAPAISQRLLGQRGIDLSGHRGRQLDRAQIEEADLILVMDRYQLVLLESLFPQSKGKVFPLRQFAEDGGGEIEDPFGGDEEEYRLCLRRIEECMPGLLKRIRSACSGQEEENP
ncbi:MAG: low molecular weight protein arginine phosphatase [candidate division NC10 bacterium]|nr:low molecular weight protein arginine phosphatase [candidate division NC10 bacterium]